MLSLHVSIPFLLNFMLGYVDYVHIELTRRIYIYIVWIVWGVELWCLMKGPELWDLVMMGWLSKLIFVDNLGCPKYKRNSAEFLVEKKNLPSNKKDMLGSFNIE